MSDEKKFTPTIVALPVQNPAVSVNQDAIEMAEGLLERLRSGAVRNCAIVEVAGLNVTTHYAGAGALHALTSGAATLLFRLASDKGV